MAKRVEPIATKSDRSGAALRAALASSVAVVLLIAWAAPSEAAPRRSWYGNPYIRGYDSPPGFSYRRARPVETTGAVQKTASKAAEPGFGEMPKGPLQIFVSIGSQKVTLYSNGVRVVQGGVSTGTASNPTPLGVFSVIEKDRHHRSNIYSGAPMPFMQRVTWSGIALHEGALPGYPASHGCIRLPHDFAAKLWPLTRLGARVIIARPDLAPADYEHPKLFSPKSKPDGAHVAMDDRPIKVAQLMSAPSTGTTVTDVTPAPEGSPSEIKDGAVAAKPTEMTVRETVKVAQPTPLAETPAETGKELGTVVPPVEMRGSVEVPETTATIQSPQAAPAVPEATSASTEPVKPVPAEIDPSKPDGPKIKKADQPQKRYGQVAVFVSRKEKKIFVRQGFAPVFEMPIVIEQLDTPLGTHVFTALEVIKDGGGMRWNMVTVPSDPARAAAPAPVNGKNKKQQPIQAAKPPAVEKHPSTAAEALDRIQFTKEMVDRISELLVPGSSLVVSDEGLGRETGRGTEFIVLTR